MTTSSHRTRLRSLLAIAAAASLPMIALGGPATAANNDSANPSRHVVIDSDYKFEDEHKIAKQLSNSTDSVVEIDGTAKEIPKRLQPKGNEVVIVEYDNAISEITAESSKCSNRTTVSKPVKSGKKQVGQADYARSKGCKGGLGASAASFYKVIGTYQEAKVVNGAEKVNPGKTKTIRWTVTCKSSKSTTWHNTAAMGTAGETASSGSPAAKLTCKP